MVNMESCTPRQPIWPGLDPRREAIYDFGEFTTPGDSHQAHSQGPSRDSKNQVTNNRTTPSRDRHQLTITKASSFFATSS